MTFSNIKFQQQRHIKHLVPFNIHKMPVRKVFCAVTNCLGLNFYDFRVSVVGFIVFQALVQFVTVCAVFYYPLFISTYSWYSGHGIYSITNIYQSILPFFIQNFLIFKAYFMRSQQKELESILRPKLEQDMGKCEMYFLLRFLTIISIRAIKFIWGRDRNNTVFNFHTAFPELIYSSNDLMFVYYVERLIEYLDYINCRVRMTSDLRIIKSEICQVFYIKRRILA